MTITLLHSKLIILKLLLILNLIKFSSLNSSSPLDVSVKGQMIADLLRIAGFMIPDPKDMSKAEGKKT